MKIFILFFVLIVLKAHLSFAEWVKISDADQIQVYEDRNNETSLMSFKGEAVIEAPLIRVASVVFDEKRAPEWVEKLKETRIFKWLSENEYLEFDHMEAPLFISDRDFVSHVKMLIENDRSKMTFLYNEAFEIVTPKEYQQSRGVRGTLNGSFYTLTSIKNNTSTLVTAEIHADPKGSLPHWLVNMFQQSWPRHILKSLRRQVIKPDIQEDPRIVQLLKAK